MRSVLCFILGRSAERAQGTLKGPKTGLFRDFSAAQLCKKRSARAAGQESPKENEYLRQNDCLSEKATPYQ
jgi:hypothetical protein